MQHENTVRQRTRTAGRRFAAMVATVGLVMIGSLVTPAAAAETDSAEAEGRVLSGGGTVNLDGIANLAPAYSADPSAPGPVASPLQLSVLSALGIDLGGGVQLFGPNGVIAVGALEQYATTSDESAYAASGALTQDGAIAVGGRGPQDNAAVDVTALLGSTALAPITQGLISQLRVELGALSATAESVGDAVATGDYQVADGTLVFTSPVVQGLTTDLRTVLTNLSTTTNAITGPQGALGSLLPGIAGGLVTPLANALRPLTLGIVNVSNVTLTAGLNVDLTTALSAITAQPLTSPDSAVSINFATGEVRADLARLIASSQGGPYDGTLNNLAPNTEILSPDLIQAALDGAVGTILDQVPALLVNTATSTLNSTAMSLRLTATAAVGSGALAVPLVSIDLTVNGTVGQFLGLPGAGAPTIDARRTAALGVVPVGTLLTPILGVVTGTLLPAIVTPLANAITGVGILDTAFRPLVTTAGTALTPVTGVINQILSITANVQEPGDFTAPGGFDEGAFTQRALSVDLLPLLGTPLAEVNLASATVRSAEVPAVEVAIAAPLDGDVLTVPSADATVDLAVTGTGEIGADVSVAAPGLPTQTTTVAPDGTWTVTFPAAGVGSYAVTATQTAGDETSSATVDVSVAVGVVDDVAITTPADGTVVSVPVDGTTDVQVTGSGQIGADVVVALSGQASQTAAVGPDGTWTATFVGVGAGSQTITATQTVGNQTSTAETTVVVDEVLAVGITLPAPGTVLTVPAEADTTSLAVTGTGEVGADVVVSAPGLTDQTATVGAAGTWTATFTDVGVGDYTVTATQTVGDQTTSATTDVSVEVGAVEDVAISLPADGAVLTVPDADSTIDVAVTGTGEVGADVLVSFPGSPDQSTTVGADGTWTVTFPAVEVGAGTITATQTLGSATSVADASITVEVGEIDGVVITSPEDGETFTVPEGSTADLVVSGTGHISASVLVSVSDQDDQTVTVGPDRAWTATFRALPQGTYTITAVQSLGAGSTDEVEAEVEAVAPVVVTAPVDGSTTTVATGGTTALVTSGTGEPGADVAVTVTGQPAQSVTVSPAGTWTATFPGLGAGSYTVTAAQQVGGLSSTSSATVSVVEAAPVVIGSPADGDVLTVLVGGSTDLVVTGTGEIGAEVVVAASAAGQLSATVGPDGTWTVTFPFLGAGPRTVTATQTVGDLVTDDEVTVDIVAVPAVTITAPTDGAVVTVPVGGTTDLEVTGTGDVGADVLVTVPGQPDQTAVVGPDGTWTASYTGLGEGSYPVTATQTVGTQTTTATVAVDVVEVDALTITSPADGDVFSTPTGQPVGLVVQGTGEVGATITVSASGQPDRTTTVDGDGTWGVTYSGLGAGTYSFVATQLVGDQLSSETVTVDVVDVVPVAITAPADGDVVTVLPGGSTDLVVSGSGEVGADVVVSVTGQTDQTVVVGPQGTWTATFPGLGEGTYEVTASQVVGGLPTAALVTVTVEAEAVGAVTITAPLDQAVLTVAAGETTDLVVTGAGDVGAEVVVSVTGATAQTVTVETDGTWTATFPGIAEGTYTVAASQTVGDDVTSASVAVVVDGVDAVTIAEPTDGSVVGVPTGETLDLEVTGTGDVGAEVVVTVDGQDDQTATVGPEGTWTVTVPGLGAGSYEVTATQTVGGVTSTEVVAVTVDGVDQVTVVSPLDGSTIGVPAGETTDLVVSGTGDVGADVVVTVTGQTEQTVVVGPEGTWTATYPGLGEGSYAITATQTVAGQVSSVELAVAVDGVDQVAITAPADGTVLSVPLGGTTDLAVEGTGDVGADITVSVPGQPDQETTVGPEGTWTVTFADLPVGTYDVTVAQLVAGQTSTAEVSVEVAVGTIEQVTITEPAPGDVVTVPEGGSIDLVVSGTGEAGGEVVVSVPGQDDQTATVEPDGTWTVTFPDLEAGTYPVTATHTAEGQTNTAVVTVEVDGVVPVTVTGPADGDILTVPVGGTTDLVVSGTGDPGADVLVVVSGQPDQTVTVGTDGTWEATFPGLPAGAYDITVTQTVGDQTTEVELSVEVDGVQAVEAVTLDEPVDGDVLAVPTGGTADLVASGTGTPGAAVEVSVTGQPVQTVTVETDGTWTATFPGLGAGTYEVTASQTVDGVSSSQTATVTVDEVEAVVILTPTDGDVVGVPEGETVDLDVTGTGDPGAEIVVSIPGQQDQTVIVEPDGTWTVTFPDLPAQSHEVTVTQTVGDQTTTEVITVEIDGVDQVTVTAPADGSSLPVAEGGTRDLVVTGSGDVGAQVVVSLDGQDDQTVTVGPEGTWTATFPEVGAGTYEVTATQTVNGQTSTQTVTVEVQAVTPVTISTPGDGETFRALASAGVDLEVTGSGDVGATVEVSISGAADQTATVGEDGSWTVTFRGLPEGTHEVVASQLVGDFSSTDSVTVEVETVDDVVITSPADGTVLDLPEGEGTVDLPVVGDGEVGAAVLVSVEGQDDQTVTVQPDGTWTATFPGLGIGTYAVTATQTVDGLVSTDTAEVEVALQIEEISPVIVTAPADGTVLRVPPGEVTDLVVEGEGYAGASIEVTATGQADQDTTVAEDGTWTVTFADVPTGTYAITAWQMVGSTVTNDSIVLVVDDAEIADVDITSPVDGAVLTVAEDGTTSSVVVGTGEPTADVVVTVPGQDAAPVVVSDDGSWTVTVPEVGAGAYTVVATQTIWDETSTDLVNVLVESDVAGVGAPFATVKYPLLVRGAGMVQEVYGTDFVPGETVSGEVRSTPLPLAPAVADAEGNVTLTFLVDEAFDTGAHQVFLTGSVSGPLGPDQLATGFVVIEPTDGVIVGPDGSVVTLPGGWAPGGWVPGASGGSGSWGGTGSGGPRTSGALARTGADDLAVGLLSGTMLLLVGGAMLAVRRRRTGD
jgi:hypothetical protein